MQTDHMIYSASMLQDFVDCPRRFQLKYVLHQSWPSIPVEPILEMEQLITRGRQFHFLVQQFFAGTPVPAIIAEISDGTLHHWFDRFLEFARAQNWQRTMSEIRFAAPLNQHQIIAVYDLIALNDGGNVHIFDWKTSLKTPKENVLARRMQTIIYPFVLFENLPRLFPVADDGQHPALEMHYWYPEYPDNILTFRYHHAQHQENKHMLHDLLKVIDLKRAASDFPLTDEKQQCRYCQYRSLCERGIHAGDLSQTDMEIIEGAIEIDFDALPDISAEI